jgi:hypothetical protein
LAASGLGLRQGISHRGLFDFENLHAVVVKRRKGCDRGPQHYERVVARESPKASYVTGAVIAADGGRTAV